MFPEPVPKVIFCKIVRSNEKKMTYHIWPKLASDGCCCFINDKKLYASNMHM